MKTLLEMEPVKPFIRTRLESEFHKNATHLIGFCFDGTTSFRPGARFGPDAIREASFGLEEYSSYLDRSLGDKNLIDLGNLPIGPKWKDTNDYYYAITRDLRLKEDQIKIVTLGGEHSISYGPIRNYLENYSDLLVIHLDAHADLRDGYLNEKFSHASIIRRVLDHFGPDHELVQYGIRSGTKEEFEWMREHRTLFLNLESFLEKIESIKSNRPVYLTLDLDYFDPAYVPGTGTPEAGGENFHSFIKLMKVLSHKNFVGADVVELAPMLDPSGCSSAFASKVVREVLLALR